MSFGLVEYRFLAPPERSRGIGKISRTGRTNTTAMTVARFVERFERVKRPRTIIIDGVRFISKCPGHYASECGRWALVRMMASTPDEMWELWTTELRHGRVDLVDMIDSDMRASGVVAHGRAGGFFSLLEAGEERVVRIEVPQEHVELMAARVKNPPAPNESLRRAMRRSRRTGE